MLDVDVLTTSVRTGTTTVARIVGDGLDRARGDRFGAWASIDESALEAARELDARSDRGPLAGVTFGVKDLFPVAGLPCRAGSRVTPEAPSKSDAPLVTRLRDLGASILGTTTMPEFAFGPTPGALNPHDTAHTPGSSSAGSAIAVAAGHVVAAVATQTNGSIIRPSSFCGVAGIKPSAGAMPVDGMPALVPTLDQPGLMAADAACLQTLWSVWTDEPAAAPPERPRVSLVRTARWHRCDPVMQDLVEEVARSLDADELAVPPEFDDAWSWMDTIIAVELAENLAGYEDRFDELTAPIREAVRAGRATTASDFAAALDGRRSLQTWAAAHLEGVDAFLTPAAPGPAPHLEDGGGSPEFSTLWSLVGAPSVTISAGRAGRLPLGVQLVAGLGRDSHLLALAASLERRWAQPTSTNGAR